MAKQTSMVGQNATKGLDDAEKKLFQDMVIMNTAVSCLMPEDYIQAIEYIFLCRSHRHSGNLNNGRPEGNTICRTLFANMQKHNHKLHRLLPPTREPTHSTRSNCTLCLDAKLKYLRTLLYRMDFTTVRRPDNDFIVFYNLLLFTCN